jgi:hypothetical protein
MALAAVPLLRGLSAPAAIETAAPQTA